MQFYGIVQKLGLTTKKQSEVDRDFIQMTILIPVNSKTNIAEFAKFYRETAEFKLDAVQGDFTE